jgi:hypothetical protein
MRHIALRSAYHAPWLGTTHPMSPATFRPRRCFLLQTQAVLSWATHVDGRHAALLLRYSYASASLPVAVFSALRFSRIPAAQALCADVGNPAKCGVIHGRRRFEAARNDAALASVPSCRSTQTPTVPFDVYLPCRSGTLRRVSSACILAVRQLSFAFVKSMIPAWSDNTDC